MFSSCHHNKSQHVTAGEPGGDTPHSRVKQVDAGGAKMADKPTTQQVRREIDVRLVLNEFLTNLISENI